MFTATVIRDNTVICKSQLKETKLQAVTEALDIFQRCGILQYTDPLVIHLHYTDDR